MIYHPSGYREIGEFEIKEGSRFVKKEKTQVKQAESTGSQPIQISIPVISGSEEMQLVKTK